jgi:hypothetical protein
MSFGEAVSLLDRSVLAALRAEPSPPFAVRFVVIFEDLLADLALGPIMVNLGGKSAVARVVYSTLAR